MGVPLGEAHQAEEVHGSGMLFCSGNSSGEFHRIYLGPRLSRVIWGSAGTPIAPKDCQSVFPLDGQKITIPSHYWKA